MFYFNEQTKIKNPQPVNFKKTLFYKAK